MNGWLACNWCGNWMRVAVSAVMGIAAVAAGAQTAQRGRAAVSCGTCHAAVVNNYAHAPMRHAMEPEGANPVLSAHPDLRVEQNGYSYHVVTKDGKSTYTVTDGKESLTVPVRWLMGMHAQTWVLEKDGRLYESLVSYFPRLNGLGMTPGDQKLALPKTITEAMGRELPVWEARECFECHGTGVRAGERLDAEKVNPGLECEHCHAGAEKHEADAQVGNFKTVPASFKKMDAEGVSDFCGQCHRTFDIVMRNKWHGPAFVRFQPYRIALSQCYSGKDARISCIACHDPHQAANHELKYYDAKCLACHGGNVKAASVGGVTAAKSCPVAKENCVSCHMPKVELPGGNQQFTDHYIRIVKQGEAYPY